MYASGSVDTLRGRVLSSWKRTEKSFSLEVIVLIGSEADNASSLIIKIRSGRYVFELTGN